VVSLPNATEPPFESEREQVEVWGRVWGCDSEVGRLRLVLMQPPERRRLLADPLSGGRPSDLSSDADDEHWYWAPGECTPRSDLRFAAMLTEWHNLVDVLGGWDVEVATIGDAAGGRFSCYARDPVVAVKGGAVVGRLPALTRRGEQRWAAEALARLGMPVIRTVTGAGTLEGGSVAWVDSTCVAVGRSNCVNEEGTRQLEEVLGGQGVEVLRVDLPFGEIHLDGAFAMLLPDLALIDPVRLPYTFVEQLDARGIDSVPLREDDDRWIVNCLVVRPGLVVMPEGLSGETRSRLEKRGLEIVTVPFDAMHENGGGIRCSTCPLVRDPIS